MANWFLLLPPEGGARQVATNLLNAFKQKIPAKALHFFDCKKYYSGFNTMLKNPEEKYDCRFIKSISYRTMHSI